MIIVIAATNLLFENRIHEYTITINRIRSLVYRASSIWFPACTGCASAQCIVRNGAPVKTDSRSKPVEVTTETGSLKPPDKDQIPVAFLISDGAVVIDFCGPWEVFQDVMIPSREDMPFRLYTVAETKKPIRTSGGMQIVPDYTIENAPPPKVIVIPAQSQPSPAILEWIRKSSKTTDVTMSVCTGAFVLAKTGLLNGKSATTYHGAFGRFAMTISGRSAQARRALCRERKSRNRRRSFFRNRSRAARGRTLLRSRCCPEDCLQHGIPGQGWMNPDSNQTYATSLVSTPEHPLCAVCGMDVDPKSRAEICFHGVTYYFCSDDDKKTFDASPEKFVGAEKNSSCERDR